MNMKKMKKFFTLSRRAEGFTLVELIVVIAILAILGGVAVPAYGGYVKKANMQADISLVSEVKQALELAYYSGELTKSGYVVLTEGKTEFSDEETTAAIIASFGSEDGLQLKYDEWAEGGNFGIYGSSVKDSFVTDNIDGLLVDLELCTGNLAWLLAESGLDGEKGVGIVNGCLGGASIDGLLEGYEPDEINENVIANAAVFGVASSLQNESNANAVIENFNGGILETEIKNTGNPNMLTETANKYAAMEAFVNYVNSDPSGCQCARAGLNSFNNQMTGASDPAAIVNSLNTAGYSALEAAVSCPSCSSKVMEYYGLDAEGNPDPNVSKSPAQKDGEAYVATMQAVNSLSDKYAASLNNPEMFDKENGVIGNDLNTYMNLAAVIPADGSYIVVSFLISGRGMVFVE